MAYPQSLQTPSPPPPRGSRLGVILGGVAAVTVVLLGVGWTLYFTGFFGAPDSGGSKPGSKQSGAEEKLAYRHSDAICQETDWSPVTEVLELEPDQVDGVGAEVENEADYTNCHLDYDDESIDLSKQLEAFVYVFDSVGGAEARYEENLDLPSFDSEREATGDWDQGRFWSRDISSGDDKVWKVGMDVQAANVSMHISVDFPDVDGPEVCEQALEQAMTDLLERLKV